VNLVRSLRRWWREVAWGRHRWLVIAAGVLTIVACLLGAYVLVLVGRIQHVAVVLPGSRPGGTTYLIVGSDSREDLDTPDGRRVFGTVRGARADILLLLRVPDDGGPSTLMSVPRDLLVLNEPGRPLGLQRLALTWLESPQRTVDALCRSLGVGVDHLAILDLEGFAKVVDAVGGIDVMISDAPVRDATTGFNALFPVRVHLDGIGALQYVRSRHLEHYDGTSWVPVANRRGDQAQQVIEQVGREAKLSPLHPLGTNAVLWAATGAVKVEAGAGVSDLRGLADAVRSVSAATRVELPVVNGDGPIPFAQLGAGASPALRAVGAGGPACSPAELPQARLSGP
jgi:LCP family protein required for cell wall assembly